MLLVFVCSLGIGGGASAVPSAAPTPIVQQKSGGQGRSETAQEKQNRELLAREEDRARERVRQVKLAYVRAELRPREWRMSMLELFADDAERGGRQERAARLREEARRGREELRPLKQQERELLEQQPGGITAPAPRPKGTPLPPPKPEKVRD